jgi:hypothetical protein
MKPKPRLRILKASITKMPNEDFKHNIHLEVENQKNWWRKNCDASNVMEEYYMIDKNGVQCGFVSGQIVSTYLVAGAKVLKDIEDYHSFLPEGNPYSIVFRVTCNEGVTSRQKIKYEAHS